MSPRPTIVRGRTCACKHHTPLATIGSRAGGPVCAAGVDRTAMVAEAGSSSFRLPCYVPASVTMGRGAWEPIACERADYPSPDEVAEEERKRARWLDLLKRGLSDCCEAAIDESGVITSGPSKGNGFRFCSACRRCLFVV